MSYKILDPQSATEYIQRHPRSGEYLNPQAELECVEIGDGNLNLVFRVFERAQPQRSILFKQGIPYLRVAGESWPLSVERATLEAKALQTQAALAPGLTPKPYWYDSELKVNAMEDLYQHQVLRKPMIGRTRYQNLGQTVGSFLAAALFGTSDFAPNSQKKPLSAQFVNPELCLITEDLIFTEPFEPRLLGGKENRNRFNPLIAADLERLQSSAAVKLEVAKLKYRFMSCAQALLHGDLHTGSIMASQPNPQAEADIRIIDPEFAFFGPMGFDIGLFVANLFLNAAAQHGHAPTAVERESYRVYLIEQAQTCWETFEADFRAKMKGVDDISWASEAFVDGFLLEVLRDTCGYAGCEMIRRTVGFAHVHDLESISDPTLKAEAERRALQLGTALIERHPTVRQFEEILGWVRDSW